MQYTSSNWLSFWILARTARRQRPWASTRSLALRHRGPEHNSGNRQQCAAHDLQHVHRRPRSAQRQSQLEVKSLRLGLTKQAYTTVRTFPSNVCGLRRLCIVTRHRLSACWVLLNTCNQQRTCCIWWWCDVYGSADLLSWGEFKLVSTRHELKPDWIPSEMSLAAVLSTSSVRSIDSSWIYI